MKIIITNQISYIPNQSYEEKGLSWFGQGQWLIPQLGEFLRKNKY
jgi:hypothetical protein